MKSLLLSFLFLTGLFYACKDDDGNYHQVSDRDKILGTYACSDSFCRYTIDSITGIQIDTIIVTSPNVEVYKSAHSLDSSLRILGDEFFISKNGDITMSSYGGFTENVLIDVSIKDNKIRYVRKDIHNISNALVHDYTLITGHKINKLH